MKIVVETEAEYNAWIAKQQRFEELLESQEAPNPDAGEAAAAGNEMAQAQN